MMVWTVEHELRDAIGVPGKCHHFTITDGTKRFKIFKNDYDVWWNFVDVYHHASTQTLRDRHSIRKKIINELPRRAAAKAIRELKAAGLLT